jgi:hypothetical protein
MGGICSFRKLRWALEFIDAFIEHIGDLEINIEEILIWMHVMNEKAFNCSYEAPRARVSS